MDNLQLPPDPGPFLISDETFGDLRPAAIRARRRVALNQLEGRVAIIEADVRKPRGVLAPSRSLEA